MRLIHDSIRFPISTAVGVLLLLLFGGIAFYRVPVQLTPTIQEPEITVTTFWPGASPHEVEREIVDEQEEQLKSLEGLQRLRSSSSDSVGTITLTFQTGTDLDATLLRVSNRLDQVPSYPADADKPIITSVDVNASAMAWFSLEPAGDKPFSGDMSTLFDFADDVIKPEMERVPGVAYANIFGGREQEMQVLVDPAALAARAITIGDLAAALERENRNYSGGDFNEGKRRYVIRTVGEYRSARDIEDLVIATRDGLPVYLRDVGRAELGYRKPAALVYEKGELVLAMNAIRQVGANTLEVMDGIKATVARLNDGALGDRGLRMIQVYDETDYVKSAISLVTDNLYVGGLLAIGVLLLFLRSFASTLVLAICIPISLVGTFLMMALFGRTLNVVSLAGLAFGVGMVVDCSIVVVENIFRHRQMGKTLFTASYEGTAEVWGAILASTVANIAVFAPVLMVKEEVGQIFGDIALALTFSSIFSLIVAITVVPALCARMLHVPEDSPRGRGFHDLWGLADAADRMNRRIGDAVKWIVHTAPRKIAVVVALIAGSVAGSWLLMPKTEYLPKGDQNFLFGIMLPPPGYSLEEMASIQKVYAAELEPHWKPAAGTPEAEGMPGGGVRDFFFVALNNLAFMGVSANDPTRVRELMPEFQKASAQTPGAIAFIDQFSIFAGGIGEGRSIEVELTGPELTRLIQLGGRVFGEVMQRMPGAQARPIPSLDLGNPEVAVVTDRRRAADLGISNRELGFAVSALVDGAKASDYQHEGKEIDLVIRADEGIHHRTHLLEQLPLATADGKLVTLGSVAHIAVEGGPVEINHSERQRTITIQVSPPERMALGEAMEIIEDQILDPMRASGDLGGLYAVRLSGDADKLVQTGEALRWNFLLAVIITFLFMASLFESFLYPLVVMLSVPLGAVGGFLGLWLVNRLVAFQPLDVITMLGFVILVGTVGNNAVLIVHQALNHIREDKMPPDEAVRESVRTRIRPIFMTVLASVVGMLPLVLFPGAGSELYRGLGSVLVGGLLVSTVFTLFLIPALFSLSLDIREAVAAALRRLLGAVRRTAARNGAAP